MPTVTMTAKELKNRIGDAFRAVSRGDRVVLTRRGKPVAILVPVTETEEEPSLLPFEEAWAEIEEALARSEPELPTLEEAMSHTRGRS
jgi:prevent-host-death family protein